MAITPIGGPTALPPIPSVLPKQATTQPAANDPIATWTKMVQAALNERNKYPKGTPEWTKANQLYISRAQHLTTLRNPTPAVRPDIVNPVNSTTKPAVPVPQPVIPKTPIPQPVIPKVDVPRPDLIGPGADIGIPKPKDTQNTIPDYDEEINPEDKPDKPPGQKETDDGSDEEEEEKGDNEVLSEGQQLEYDFKNKELKLNDKFRYYQTNQQHQEFVSNLEAALKQMRIDAGLQGRALDNEELNIIGTLENEAKRLKNELALGTKSLDVERAIAKLQADVERDLGNKGLDVQLNTAMAQIEAQTMTGLTGMYLEQERAAGELAAQEKATFAGLGTGLLGDMMANRSAERTAGINAAGQMAPAMRQISSNERTQFGAMGADLANNQMAMNAQRQTELMSMGLSAEQAIRQVETERQLGLTDQTMRGYETLAQLNQQPENWLTAFHAMRGMNAPATAKTGQAESLGQYLQQLSAKGLNIDPLAAARNDPHAGQAFREGRDINPNMLNGDMGQLIDNYNNAAFQGLGAERADAQHQTGRMYDIGEYGRGQDAQNIQGMTNKLMGEGLQKTNTLGQAGYDPEHMYNRLIPMLSRSDYYDPTNIDQNDQPAQQKRPKVTEPGGPQDEMIPGEQTFPQMPGGGPQDEMTPDDWTTPGMPGTFQAYNPQDDWSSYMQAPAQSPTMDWNSPEMESSWYDAPPQYVDETERSYTF